VTRWGCAPEVRSKQLTADAWLVAIRIATFFDWFGRDVLAYFVATRLALTAVGLAASSHGWLAIWSDWDAGWYLSIARDGYSYHLGEQSNVAFAPGLPLLMHLGGMLARNDSDPVYTAAGLIVTNLALLVALGYLVALVRLDFDKATASRAALYALVFPSTLFLSAVYPHALFLAAAIPAFYYARQGRWWLAGLLGSLAGVARLQGIVIVVPLLYEYLAARHFELRRVRLDVLGLALVPLGWLSFAAYLLILFGDPRTLLEAGSAWGRHLSPPWEALLSFWTQGVGAHGTDRSPLDLAFTLFLIGLVALTWSRLRVSLALSATLFLLIMLSSGLLVSSMRYGLELFPIFIALAISSRHRMFHVAYVVVAGYLALRFMSEFANSIWVA
jgi:hypothetical protein